MPAKLDIRSMRSMKKDADADGNDEEEEEEEEMAIDGNPMYGSRTGH